MATIQQKLNKKVEEGTLREQCAGCQCEKIYHSIEDRHCSLCWNFCIYEPAWVIRPPKLERNNKL